MLKNGASVNYTVPQKVEYDKIGNFVEVFFRVSQVLHNATIVVRAGDQVLMQMTREHMLPAEMERIVLPKKLLKSEYEQIQIEIN